MDLWIFARKLCYRFNCCYEYRYIDDGLFRFKDILLLCHADVGYIGSILSRIVKAL